MKVVLAYSGGLDTSVAIVWLKQIKQVWVHAVLVDVGQTADFEALEKQALKLGADRVSVIDKKDALAAGLQKMVLTSATYEANYLLGTAIARPFIADALVETALESGASAICHGATSKGNDYLRFEQRIRLLAPGVQIIAPWREWPYKDRASAEAVLAEYGVFLPQKDFSYSVDENMWHASYEGGELEHLDQPLPKHFQKAIQGSEPIQITLEFENGLPIGLNGQSLGFKDLVMTLNQKCSESGYGWIDIVETRVNGVKSRGLYHTPAGTLIYQAKSMLQDMWFSKPSLEYVAQQGNIFGKMLYGGIWDHPVQKAIHAATSNLFAGKHGSITLEVCGSSTVAVKREATPNLFQEQLGGFGNMDEWPHEYSEGLVFFQHLQNYSQAFPQPVGMTQ